MSGGRRGSAAASIPAKERERWRENVWFGGLCLGVGVLGLHAAGRNREGMVEIYLGGDEFHIPFIKG